MEEENTSSCDDDHHQICLIPQDVLIQILVLLPIISLLRFKSVCKSWRALIQSSFFIDLHLNNTTNTTTNNNNFGTFIFQTSDYYLNSLTKNEAFMLSSSSAAAGGGEDDDEEDNRFEKLLKLEDLVFPPRYNVFWRTYTDDIFMVGSYNGLICIHDSKRKEVSLWNPATRQFRLLPESLTSLEAGIPGDHDKEYLVARDFVGLGYDVKTNDYKVVLISHFRPHHNMSDKGMGYEDMSDEDTLDVWLKECIFRVQVYSFTTDSWKLLEGINSLPAIPRKTNRSNRGVYLNGSYYFLGTYLIGSKPTHMLLSFDFTKEIFTTIQLPHDYRLTTILTSFGEKQLAVFARMPDESDFVPYDVWVLNKHHGGVKEKEEEEELWTKLHSIRLINKMGNYFRGVPICISNNGEFALIYTEGCRVINGVDVFNCCLLQLFNLVTQEVKKEFHTETVIRAEVYKQTLVWIGGNGTTTDRVIGAEM